MIESTIDFQTIGLVGCGSRGVAIAEVFALSGRRVIAIESDPATAEQAEAALAQSGDRVTISANLEELSAADLVIETVPEGRDAKASVLAAIAAVVGSGTPITTATASLSVTDLAASVPAPERVAGLHFLSTGADTRTVEVVRGLDTADEVIGRLVHLLEGVEGKDPVVVKDRPRFLVNALLVPFLNDVVQAYDDELATADDIDLALQLGLGYRRGPLEMLDQIGLDTHLDAAESLYDATRDVRYAPPPLLRQMVRAGRLGSRNGKGFRCGSRTES